MKICILGAGALGCAIGSALIEAGHDIWLLSRSLEHVETMNHHGLRVHDEAGNRQIAVKAATKASDVGPVDLVIVLVKSFHTQEAMAGAMALVGTQTLVLSLQNGLGHEDILAELVGRDRVLAGKTYVGGVLLKAGEIRASITGKQTYIGELDGQITPRVQAIAEVFKGAGLATTVSNNILGTMWDKLLINVATGALSGITRLSYGQLYTEPLLENTAIAAVAEAMSVAKAANIQLSIKAPEAAWKMAAEGLPANFRTSMLQSLEKGSVTEIDFINGSVVRWGQRHGVATPVNATLIACIKGIERAMADQSTQ